MALSSAEEESIESIKKWWRESGWMLASGIALVLVIYFGWQQWQGMQQRSSAAASAVFDQLSDLAVTAPGEPVADREQAMALISELREEHGNSSYALYAGLFAARLAVEAGDLQAAERELRWVLDNRRDGFFRSTDESLILTAQWRLGRVLLAQGDAEGALGLISGVDPQNYAAEFAELEGDIYVALGQSSQARAAYQSALEAGSDSPVLLMKLNSLAEQG